MKAPIRLDRWILVFLFVSALIAHYVWAHCELTITPTSQKVCVGEPALNTIAGLDCSGAMTNYVITNTYSSAGTNVICADCPCPQNVTNCATNVVIGVGSVQPSPVSVCAGDATNFTVSAVPAGETFPHDPTWTVIPATAGSISASGTSATFTASGTYTGAANVWAACGTSSNSASVSVIHLDSVSPTNVFLCIDGSANFSATAVGGSFPGGQPVWAVSPGTAGSVNPTNGSSTTFTADPGLTNTATIIATCGSSAKTATATIVFQTISPGSGWETCVGASNTFTATPNIPGGTFQWAPGGTAPNDATTIIVFTTPGEVVVSNTYSLGGASCTVTTVGTNYDLMLSPTNFGPICQGETNTFVATTTVAGKTFSWNPAGVISNAADGKSSTNMVPFGAFGTNIPVTVTYGPCSNTALGTVTAVTNVVPNSTNICAHTTVGVTFTAQASAPGTFPCTPTWTFTPTNAGMLSTTQGVSTAFTPTNSFRGQVLITAHAGTSTSTATGNVFEVNEVVWLQLVNPLSGSPAPNPGQRMFAERTSATATPNVSNQMVLAIATLNPAVSNATIYFKAIDVDDPSTNMAPVDSESDSQDNHGSVNGKKEGELAMMSVLTAANGKATNTFTATPQPGDNFRLVCSCEQTFANGFQAVQNVTNGALTNATAMISVVETNFVSPMLTTWRSVHIEKDSMSGVDGQNYVTGFVTRVNGLIGGPLLGATQAILSVNLRTDLSDNSPNLDVPGGTGANGRFENGQITIGTQLLSAVTMDLLGNGDTYVDTKLVPALQFLNIPFTISNGVNTASGMVTRMVPTGGGRTTVGVNTALTPILFNGGKIDIAGHVFSVIQNGVRTVAIPGTNNTLNFVLHDDDIDFLALPKSPDTSLLAAALQEAYVEPKFNTTGVADSNSLTAIAFDANMTDGEQFTNVFASGGTANLVWGSIFLNLPDFWVAYEISAFQFDVLRDGDPDAERFAPGFVEGHTLVPLGCSAIFLETIREKAKILGISQAIEEQATAVHEFGHGLGSSTNEPVIQCDDPNVCTTNTVRYSPEYIDLIRRAPRPGAPGGP